MEMISNEGYINMKYPDVKVKLIGTNGNTFSILANVVRVAKKHKVPQSDIDEFMKEAMSGDYDNSLSVCIKWFNVY
jgi:putative lipoic acid-binding regulatory protein